jgi:hypothetical protein
MTERAEPDQVAVTDPDAAVPAGSQNAEHPPASRTVDRSSAAISAVLLVVFVAAFVNARQWQAIVALFPLAVTAIGAVLAAVFLVRSLTGRGSRTARRAPTGDAVEPPRGTDPVGAIVEQAEEADHADAEQAFYASLGRRDWLVSLGCFAAFFVGLALAGLYVATVVFTIAYLRYQAGASWRLSVIYAVVLATATYGLFGAALQLPVPGGLLDLA